MGRVITSRRRRPTAWAGSTAVACVAAAVAAAPSFAQAPVGRDVESATEQVATPVAAAAEPVSDTTEQLAGAAETVTPALEPVAEAAEPASTATRAVAAVAEPAADTIAQAGAGQAVDAAAGAAKPAGDATAEATGAAEPVRDLTDRVAGAARPVLDATDRVAGAAQPDGDGSRPSGGLLRRRSGGPPPSGFDRSRSNHLGAAERNGAGLAPGASPGPLVGGHLPGLAPEAPAVSFTPAEPRAGASPDARPTEGRTLAATAHSLGAGQADAAWALLPDGGWTASYLLTPAELLGTDRPAMAAAATGADAVPAGVSPDEQPTPGPSAPTGAGAASAASGAPGGPVLALLALLLLAAPSLSRFLRTVPEFLRPAPFIVALERPG